MTPHPDSPNGRWQRLGYSIECDHRGARTIRRPDGSVVDVPREEGEDKFSAEIRAAEREAQQELPL